MFGGVGWKLYVCRVINNHANIYFMIKSKKATKAKKIPIFAGMQFCNGKTIKNNIHKVGYKVVKFFYIVDVYENGHQDFVLVAEKTVKTVLFNN